MSSPNWFNVFNSTQGTWLQDDERSWGPYTGAAAFTDRELAHDVAGREMRKDPGISDVVVVLGDFGSVDPTVSEVDYDGPETPEQRICPHEWNMTPARPTRTTSAAKAPR